MAVLVMARKNIWGHRTHCAIYELIPVFNEIV